MRFFPYLTHLKFALFLLIMGTRTGLCWDNGIRIKTVAGERCVFLNDTDLERIIGVVPDDSSQVASVEKTPDGKHISVTKNRNEGFTMNVPGSFLVPPGESQVYPVQLDTEWDNRPTFADSGDTPVTVKAIYEVTPTTESTKYGVWTGRIESVGYKFTLTHW